MQASPPISRSHIWQPLLIALVLFGTYAPALFSEYGMTDDYPNFNAAREQPELLLKGGVAMGRPITGLIWYLTLPLADDIAGLAALRAVTVALIVAFALLLWHLTRRVTGTSSWVCMAFALAVALTPTFQVYAAWTTCMPLPLAAITGLLAGHWAALPMAGVPPTRLLARCAAAAALFFVACLSYQPAAMFFWLIPALRLLRDRELSWPALGLGVRCLMVAGSALAAAFVVYRLGASLADLKETRGTVAFDPLGKISWFVDRPLRHFLVPWILLPKIVVAAPVALMIAAGMVLFDRPSIRRAILRMAVFGMLLVLAYLPNLLIRENWSSFRTMGAGMAIGLVAIWTALRGYVGLLPALRPAAPLLAAVAALAFAIIARWQVTTYLTAPQAAEWRFVREQVAASLGDPAQEPTRFVVVRPGFRETLAPTVHYDEFGLPSSHPPTVPQPLVAEALISLGYKGPQRPVESAEAPPSPSPGVQVIDVKAFVTRPR